MEPKEQEQSYWEVFGAIPSKTQAGSLLDLKPGRPRIQAFKKQAFKTNFPHASPQGDAALQSSAPSALDVLGYLFLGLASSASEILIRFGEILRVEGIG